jgi:hypothetical protein
MTNENVRKEDMLIGNHFGKRKPQWNFFIKSYEDFKYSWSLRLIKLISLGLAAQVVILSPVIYWIYQNYAIIETHVPIRYNLRENIQFEKKWILFLIVGTTITQAVFNFFMWRSFMKNTPAHQQVIPTNGKLVLLDEADYQRHAS